LINSAQATAETQGVIDVTGREGQVTAPCRDNLGNARALSLNA